MKAAKSVQTLVATMNQKDTNIIQKMNIQTDTIIGNQCDRNEIIKERYKTYEVLWLNFNEKGVGLNRNNSLMRANADIIVFADDDMVFFDGYRDTVLNIFNSVPEADVVIFNIKEKNPTRKVTKKAHFTRKIGYGAARIACRRKVIHENGIFFNLCFGGGTPHSNGEDTLFLAECVIKKLKLYVVPEAIAELKDERESTWFFGYTDKYFEDRGVLLAASRLHFIYLRGLKAAFREAKRCEKGWWEIFNLYIKGILKFKKRTYE